MLGLEIVDSRNSDMIVPINPLVLLHKLRFSISFFCLCLSGGDGPLTEGRISINFFTQTQNFMEIFGKPSSPSSPSVSQDSVQLEDREDLSLRTMLQAKSGFLVNGLCIPSEPAFGAGCLKGPADCLGMLVGIPSS